MKVSVLCRHKTRWILILGYQDPFHILTTYKSRKKRDIIRNETLLFHNKEHHRQVQSPLVTEPVTRELTVKSWKHNVTSKEIKRINIGGAYLLYRESKFL